MKLPLQFKNLLLLTVITVCLSGVSELSFGKNGDDLLQTGDQLNGSITIYKNQEFGPISTIIKSWNETFDARSEFDLSFYGYFSEPQNKQSFFQTIKVFDEANEVHVHEGDFADCSFEKVILARKNGLEYLVLANRLPTTPQNEIVPLSDPARQSLSLFKLFGTTNPSPSQTQGMPRSYFQKIAGQVTDESFCTPEKIYLRMQEFLDKNVKTKP